MHRALVLVIAASALAGAQSVPSFEVASIHVSTQSKLAGEGSNRSRIEYTPTTVTARNVSMQQLIEWAYEIGYYQISGPEPKESFDIIAKSEHPGDVSQLRLMMQGLLARRFNLRFRRETKPMPVFALVVSKGGSKLPMPKAEADIVNATENLPRIESGAFVFHDTTLSNFAMMLHQLRGIELPVEDRTGIKGVFDISLKGAPAVTRDGDTSGLFAIIKQQLGLKMISSRAPIEMFVIEHAEKPTEN